MNSITYNSEAHDKIYKKYNAKHAEIYNPFEQSRLKGLAKRLKELVAKEPVQVLDVGAGTGNLSLKFLEVGCEVTAADVSRKSLDLLTLLSGNDDKLKTAIISDKGLPFASEQFDIAVTYSVLHHVPDYLHTVREMLRVVKKSGYVFIDHEANAFKWEPSEKLKEYYSHTQQTPIDYLKKVIKSGEIFTPSFWKAVFIKSFVNKRYQREGDIHVWKDDHIDWEKIKQICLESNASIVEEVDYLLYKQKGGLDLFNQYKDHCSDTKFMIIRK